METLAVRTVGLAVLCSWGGLACGSKQEEARPSYLPENVPGPGTPGGTAASSFVEGGASPGSATGPSLGTAQPMTQQMLANRPMLVPEVPEGVVTGCFGEQCPAGACEAEAVGDEVLCAAAYPMAVTNISSLCPFRDEASFCMNLEDAAGDWLWAVSCDGSQANFELCTLPDGSALCEAMAGEPATCVRD